MNDTSSIPLKWIFSLSSIVVLISIFCVVIILFMIPFPSVFQYRVTIALVCFALSSIACLLFAAKVEVTGTMGVLTATIGGPAALWLASLLFFNYIYPPPIYVFQGQIKNLRDYEKITSSSLYFKTVFIPKHDPVAPQIREEHFIVFQEKPFTGIDQFDIFYSKGEQEQKPLWIKYTSGIYPILRIEWDPKVEGAVLKDINTSSSVKPFFANTIYGRGAEALAAIDVTTPTGQDPPFSSDLAIQEIINSLQNESTDVGTKILILDKLNSRDNETLEKIASISTSKEPMVLTLLDLTRHTDKELSYKANNLIKKRFDLDLFLSRKLTSSDEEERDEGVKIVHRIEVERAKTIIKKLDKEANTSISELLKPKDIRVLIPTGSAQGDRYYVKAEWSSKDEDIMNCLTRLFNSSLASTRTMEEETKLMRNRNTRLVYWYSKQWALGMAREIERCGAKASFVNGYGIESIKTRE